MLPQRSDRKQAITNNNNKSDYYVRYIYVHGLIKIPLDKYTNKHNTKITVMAANDLET